MAWSDPVHLDTGDFVIESHWNVHRDDLLVLRTGGLAISAQDTGTIPFASSPTQLGMSANLAFDGSSLVVAGAADNTGLIVSATTTNRPMISMQNADTGVIGQIQADNNGRILFYSAGYGTPTLTIHGSIAEVGGVSIGEPTQPPGPGCLNVEGGAVLVGDPAFPGIYLFVGGQVGTVQAPHAISVASGAHGTGAVSGSYLSIGRNTSGGGAAGNLGLFDKSGVGWAVWTDVTGLLRIAGVSPTENGTPTSDTSGTVVGAQSSTLDAKDVLGEGIAPEDALALILATPVTRFRYKGNRYGGTIFHGIIADESPAFAMDPNDQYPQGRSFNPVNGLGISIQAMKALAARIAALEAA